MAVKFNGYNLASSCVINMVNGKRFSITLVLSLMLSIMGCSQSDEAYYQPQILDEPPAYMTSADFSVARKWNELLLSAIRLDYARPTVHARNLFHISAAMFDAWALFDAQASPYLINSSLASISQCQLVIGANATPAGAVAAQQVSISYGAYYLINHRFKHSPEAQNIQALSDTLMQQLGYDLNVNFDSDSPARLGRDIANCYIEYGLSDGANEANLYANQFYEAVNPPLPLSKPGNGTILDLDRWQPLAFAAAFIDQSGNQVSTGSAPDFLSPEWGRVLPFALSAANLQIHDTAAGEYWLYHDPGAPPLASNQRLHEYQWGFALVAAWSSHLDGNDGVMVDISPASIGNVEQLPSTFTGMQAFYLLEAGGDSGQGYDRNPITATPYPAQWVPRGDYARVLAEFWADGPDSETPPGHWFVILNAVADHPLLAKQLQGQGELLGNLEWDIKAYFTLGGAMHDAAISAWGAKGHYDYIRPISAIRAMAELGQSSDESVDNYHPQGIPLMAGFIEVVTFTDDLAGALGRDVGKIKIKAWQGHTALADPQTDTAGVGWILAENWWPYQRPSFVTPPFAGYVSGHSTFSRAAAEVLSAYTGSDYFPGGVGEFKISANDFLVFESGPSMDLTLQWASYKDASDQCSLSRIWGGIHPPADDIPGRMMGITIGQAAFQKALSFF